MKKYIILSILLLIVGFFTYLFIERQKNIASVQDTTEGFFLCISGQIAGCNYEDYLHEKFKDVFNNQLLDKYPGNFSNIISIDKTNIGMYKKSTDTGTTFEYQTVVRYSYEGENSLDTSVKLQKNDGKWLIYGIYFN